MKKTDVYVVVDTTKKAKKLKKLLDMFGENIYSDERDFFNWCKTSNTVYFFPSEDEWHYKIGTLIGREEVSIKELRNILAKEHLKEGDIIVAGIGSAKYVVNVEKVNSSNTIPIGGNKWICIDGDDYPNEIKEGEGGFRQFIRYATEEEKALLEPKKELEVGKWYKGNVDIESLIFITEIENAGYYNRIHGYGFKDGQWNDAGHLFSNTDHEKALVEATPKEVEMALIGEAKRRGFVNGSVGNNSNIHDKKLKDCELFFNNKYEFYEKDNLLRVILDADTTWTVFKYGQWATIIEQDKLSNLKEAYNNGYCVEFYDVKTDTWKRHENPCWNPDLQWRIMVNNGHLVVSDVYLLNQIEELKKSIDEIKSNIIQ